MPRSDDAYQTTALPQARGSDHAGSTLCEPASSYRGRDKPPPSCPAASSGEKWLRDALCALNASRPAEAGVAGGALARNGDGGALDDDAGTQAQRDDLSYWRSVGNKCKKSTVRRRKMKLQELAGAQGQAQASSDFLDPEPVVRSRPI